MAERVARKAKILFDTKEKVKHRYAAFESILEILPTIDGRTAFFKEHLHDLISFALDSFYFFGEKLETSKEYRDKIEKAIEREGLQEFFFFPKIFEYIMTYVPDLLNASLDSPMVVNCLRRMMMPTSHRELRREALRLLLIWMKFGFREDTRQLFVSCVDLTQFNADPSAKITVHEFPITGQPLIRSNLSLIKQAEDMFEDMLHLITYDQDANRACIQAIYKEFRKTYLSALYPNVFREYKLMKQEAGGFTEGCPQRLQVILIKYLAIWLLPENSSKHHPISSFIFVDLLLSSPIDSEIVHEILRQGLLLPWDHSSTIKSVMSLYKWWIFQAPKRRPSFLQEDLHKVLQEDSAEPVENALMEIYVDRYIRRVASLFDGRPSFGVEVGQFECYREAIAFFRGVGVGLHFKVSQKIWNSLITTTLSIIKSHLVSNKNGNIIGIQENSQKFAALIVETLVGLLIRSGTKEKAHWEAVCYVIQKCTRWTPVVTEWSRIATALTALYIEINYPPVDQDQKGSSRHLSVQSKHYRVASVEDLTAVLLNGPSYAAIEDDDDPFLDWKPIAKPAIKFLWRNWLRVIGDLCGIDVPGNHELALRTFASILERLCDVHTNQWCDAKDIPPLFEFVDALLDACDMTTKGFEQSRCIAIAALAKLLCRQTDVFVPKELYDRFYLALINGMVEKDSPVALVVLRATSHIFSYDIPGSTLLIPACLRCIASILNAPLASHDVFVAILRLATSIALLPDIFPTLLTPRIEAPLPSMSGMPVVVAGEVCLEDVRSQVQYFIALTANHLREAPTRSPSDPLIYSQLVCSTFLLLLNELVAVPKQDQVLVEKYLDLIITCMDQQPEPSVSLFSAIEGLIEAFPLSAFPLEIQISLTQSFIGCLHRFLRRHQQSNPNAVVQMVHGLLGWVMALPTTWLFDHEDVSKALFDVLFVVLQTGGAISDAGKFMLSHLMAHMGHCCPLEPYSEDPKDVPATRQIYYGLGSCTILCVEEIGVTESTGSVRLISRTPAGKFTWEFEGFHDVSRTDPVSDWSLDGIVEALSLSNAVLVESLEAYLPADLSAKPSSKPVSRPKHQAPQFNESTDLESTDMLADLLAYLEEEFPEMEDAKVPSADFIPPAIREEVLVIRDQCLKLVDAEKQLSQNYAAALSLTASYETPYRHRIAMPIPFEPKPTSFQYCRQLVLQFGLLGLDDQGRFPVKVLSPSNALQRELRALDTRGGPRETAKVGLIYVGPGCETEASVLGCQTPSESYRDFCEALGSYVSLASHRGFTGGLDASMTVDGKALYYSTSIVEAIFHEPSRILSSSQDDHHFLGKKRHVGNDLVHIIWNEHWRPYKPSTISGDFGNYQIVISPKPDLGLYAINIYADGHFPTAKMGVGPLFDGALVPRALLATLVRATAISADRLMALDASGGITPVMDRKTQLNSIITRYGGQWGIEKILSHAAFGEERITEPIAPPSQPEITVE